MSGRNHSLQVALGKPAFVLFRLTSSQGRGEVVGQMCQRRYDGLEYSSSILRGSSRVGSNRQRQKREIVFDEMVRRALRMVRRALRRASRPFPVDALICPSEQSQ